MNRGNGREKPEVSLEEYIALIRHSSIPTIIVEGKDDIIVYRRIENECGIGEVSVLPVDGRTKILAMFQRWNEIKAVVKGFIADRDTWVITGVPIEFNDDRILLTSGYSVENDAYIDGNFERYLYPEDVEKFRRELELFLRWYSIALSRHLQNSSFSIENHPNSILDGNGRYDTMVQLLPDEVFPQDLYNNIKENYALHLRGKSLIDVLIRHLSYKGRPVNHHSRTLLEFAAVNRGVLLTSTFNKALIMLGKPIKKDDTVNIPVFTSGMTDIGPSQTGLPAQKMPHLIERFFRWISRYFRAFGSG